jgi:hypothetical protein
MTFCIFALFALDKIYRATALGGCVMFRKVLAPPLGGATAGRWRLDLSSQFWQLRRQLTLITKQKVEFFFFHIFVCNQRFDENFLACCYIVVKVVLFTF